MKVLVACEFSGIVREAFVSRGHDAWSCDLLPTEIPSAKHYQCDVLSVLANGWDLMIAHPPCTYLTNAGVRHLHENITSKNGVKAKVHGAARMREMEAAAQFFLDLFDFQQIAKICVENPIPHKYAKAIIGNYTQLIQPWQFGHPESKATCLWLKGLPKLVPTNNVKEYMLTLPKREQHRVHHTAPSKDRWKIRSRTYIGIAKAMAEQWG